MEIFGLNLLFSKLLVDLVVALHLQLFHILFIVKVIVSIQSIIQMLMDNQHIKLIIKMVYQHKLFSPELVNLYK